MDEVLNDEQRTLVEKNIDLAHHLALDAWRKNPQGQDKDDIVATAYEGLVTAAARFDPSRADVDANGKADVEGAFSGYARRRINGAILDWQRRRDHVPRRQRSVYREFVGLGRGEGRSPQELSDLTGMPVDRVSMIITAVESPPMSLTMADEGSTVSVQREIESPEQVEGQAMETRIRETVVEVFDELPEIQQIVIALRYYEGLDLTDVAQTTGFRLATVRAAHAEGLLSLHAAMMREAS